MRAEAFGAVDAPATAFATQVKMRRAVVMRGMGDHSHFIVKGVEMSEPASCWYQIASDPTTNEVHALVRVHVWYAVVVSS